MLPRARRDEISPDRDRNDGLAEPVPILATLLTIPWCKRLPAGRRGDVIDPSPARPICGDRPEAARQVASRTGSW